MATVSSQRATTARCECGTLEPRLSSSLNSWPTGPAAALAVQRMTGVAPGHPLTATVGGDGALRLLSAPDGTLLMTPLERDVGGAVAAIRPDGRVAVAWDDGRVDVVDIRYFDRHLRGNETYQRSRLPKR